MNSSFENETFRAIANDTNTTDGLDVIAGTIGMSIPSTFLSTGAVVWHGYIMPGLAVIVLVVNSLAVAVFCRQDHTSPTHILMSVIALVDTLCLMVPVPMYIYFFTLGNYHEYISYAFCYPWEILYIRFMPFAQTIGMWIHVSLGVTRYICVRFPFAAKRLLTLRRTFLSVLLINVACSVLFLPTWAGFIMVPVTVNSKLANNQTMTSCNLVDAEWIKDIGLDQYYYWLLLVLVFRYVIPLALLIFLNIGILAGLRTKQKIIQNPDTIAGHCRRKEINRLSIVVFFVLTLTIVSDIPALYPLVDWIVEWTGAGETVMSLRNRFSWFMYLRCVRSVLYLMNFISYCVISSDFRSLLRQLLHLNYRRATFNTGTINIATVDASNINAVAID